jgi:choice-of-anchor B domain-containing protein
MDIIKKSYIISFRIMIYLNSLLLLSSCQNDENVQKTSFSLTSMLSLENGNVTDVWGYEQNGHEYAIIGTTIDAFPYGNVNIVDVTEPSNPNLLSSTPMSGFDMKVWGHYLYVGNGHVKTLEEMGSRVLDISDPSNPKIVGSFPTCHNLFIDDKGYMYLTGSVVYEDSTLVFVPGIRIYDLNSNVTNPKLIWSGGESTSHDITVIDNTLYLFGGKFGTTIYDITNRNSPVQISHLKTTDEIYDHSGWVTEDGNYLFICNELANSKNVVPSESSDFSNYGGSDIYIWDISDKIELIGTIHDDDSRVHNLYIVDNFAYISYYDAGLKIFEISNPEKPILYYSYDTNQVGDLGFGDGFTGAFGVFPFTSKGNIYVSDIDHGLYIFQKMY